MSRIFDYNGSIVAPSNPVKRLKTVKKMLNIDSGDRDLVKYPAGVGKKGNGDFVVYLPRVYENVVSIRLVAAEFPASFTFTDGITVNENYFLIDIEGLNKSDECSVGADRSGYPDGYFAKIPWYQGQIVYYNDHSAQENIAHYSPAIGKLDRMHITTRLHAQKPTGACISWQDNEGQDGNKEYSLTFEIEMLDNSFDDFSQFETRLTDRA